MGDVDRLGFQLLITLTLTITFGFSFICTETKLLLVKRLKLNSSGFNVKT